MEILIVENDDLTREVLQIFFDCETNHKTKFVKNCKEANHHLTNIKPDVILLDYFLGDGTAEEVISYVRKLYASGIPLYANGTPRIILSSAMVNLEETSRIYKVDGFVKKPYTFEELILKLDDK